MTEIRVLMPLAEGVEEMEAVIIADVLRRAGAALDIKGLSPERIVTASRGVLLGHEGELTGDETADVVVLPGGAEGARRLGEDERILEILRRQERDDRWIAAICAAPSVLAKAGVAGGKKLTSHPSVRGAVEPHAGSYVEDGVVIDPKVVTGRGPGVALDFALDLVGLFFGPDKASEVREPMMFEVLP